MGFFSDLKEDLSQAVNELMPEETANEVKDEVEAEDTTATEEAETVVAEEQAVDTDNADDMAQLEAMLGRVDSIELPEDMDVTKMEEEPETDLETSIRAAFGEKEETKGEEKKMDMQTKTAVDETAIITAGMTITGDVSSEGSMEVIGAVNGNIDILGKLNITGSINGNSKAAEIYADNAKITGEVVSEGAVKIGQSSVIIGNISAKSAVIAGAVKGDIDVRGPVILDASAIVMGNIKSKAVQINNGAVIEGMCSQCYAEVNPTAFFDEYKKGKNK
ncbi:MAG: polymer-forming cytoskeletal protein [Lachnospiraceae bacterium]|nr:polymer-forming cytoskeletal protein [Lachnospiraceae bacterium]MBQ7780833.1 polymer-forming cytoskeletal protein [Lachnospiraceae bacterium]